MGACLRVVSVAPENSENYINLDQKDCYLLGRSHKDSVPDISFTNYYVGRRHALIKRVDGDYFIINLNSANGVGINCEAMAPGEKIKLENEQVVCLYKNIKLQFLVNYREGDTLKGVPECNSLHCRFEAAVSLKEASIPSDEIGEKVDDPTGDRIICPGKIQLGGVEYTLRHKLWLLLEVLYNKQPNLVSLEEICKAVWPEDDPDNADLDRISQIPKLIYDLKLAIGDSDRDDEEKYIINAGKKFGYLFREK